MTTFSKDSFAKYVILPNENEVFTGTFHNDQQYLKPLMVKDFICPRCQGKEAFVNPDVLKGRFLTCLKETCIYSNAGKKPIFKKILFNLAQCNVDEEYQKASFQSCSNLEKNVLDSLKQMALYHAGFLVLAGPSGIGKTYAACAALAEYLKHNNSGYFIKQADLYQQWLECKRSNTSDFDLLHKLQDKDLLIFDEFGSKPSDSFQEFLGLLIDKRKAQLNKGTIFTTNKNSKDILNDFDSPIASRISSGKCFILEGHDRRIHKF